MFGKAMLLLINYPEIHINISNIIYEKSNDV